MARKNRKFSVAARVILVMIRDALLFRDSAIIYQDEHGHVRSASKSEWERMRDEASEGA